MSDKQLLDTAQLLYCEVGRYTEHSNLAEVFAIIDNLWHFMRYDLQLDYPIGYFEQPPEGAFDF